MFHYKMSIPQFLAIEEGEGWDESRSTTDSSMTPDGDENCAPEIIQKEEIEVGGSSVSSAESGKRTLGQFVAGEEDEDGFITPTGPEHRIPVMTQCPPAPKQKRGVRENPPAKKKRKFSSANNDRIWVADNSSFSGVYSNSRVEEDDDADDASSGMKKVRIQ